MQVKINNTLTRSSEVFRPLVPGEVTMYNCGPTVYDQAHIGNLRSYLMADTIRRVFEYLRYRVRQVTNITDVGHLTSDADEGDDRMVVGAHRLGKDPIEVARHFERLFFADRASLNILYPHVVCRATEHIPDMIALVQRLEALGYTYQIDDGVYFDVGRLPGYGRLARQALDEMKAGARVQVNVAKRHPSDFALWRLATPEHIMQWDSPWGRGYPGWHIECSAMSMKYLGETFDIHTGGEDHIPTHHQNEIAQSEAATGKTLANYWVHCRFLRWRSSQDAENSRVAATQSAASNPSEADEEKMSKTSGKFLVLDDLSRLGYDPLAFRYMCLTAGHHTTLAFSWEALQGAASSLRRLQESVRRLGDDFSDQVYLTDTANDLEPDSTANTNPVESVEDRFRSAIADDFNMPAALVVLWDTLHEANRATGRVDQLRWLERLLAWDNVLGLGLSGLVREFSTPEEITELIARRATARQARPTGTQPTRSAMLSATAGMKSKICRLVPSSDVPCDREPIAH